MAAHNAPRVSVVIPTYNRARFIGEAIDSVLAQTFTDYEIIVVDDGSTDKTLEALHPYRDRIRYVVKNNQGPAGARNRGVQESRGALVAFLDSDDLWLPEKLALQTARLDRRPELAMVFTEVMWVERDGSLRPSRFRRYRPRDGFVLRETIHHPCIATQSILIKREAFDAVRFDESLLTGEGLDFNIRLALRFPIGLVDRPLVKIRKHDANLDLEWNRVCQQDADVKYQAFFVDFQRICEKCPELKLTHHRATRQALSGVYRDWGKSLLYAGRPTDARARLAESWRMSAHPKTIASWLKTWIPRG